MIKIGRLLVTIACTIAIIEFSRKLVYKARDWFPKNRILYTFLVGVCGVALILAFGIIARNFVGKGVFDTTLMVDSHVFVNGKKVVIGLLGNCLVNAIFIFPFLYAAFEIIYHASLARFNKEEKQQLEKEKLKAELQQLKGIINPHFLFNNLNSLSSLISENPQEAQEFLDELTKVFRYLLRNNETDLTTLGQELQFIQSYYNLLQTRYGKGISLDIRIDEKQHNLLIPPLTLQLLIENAVKHNSVNKDSPLRIELFTTDTKGLKLRNNLSPRKGQVESTGIGLQNINARYSMLNHQGVIIEKDNETFSVLINLIET
jgi:LytS/YehU family sensor histidine kinase